ncbi:hypothetical protein L0F63_005998 [Massospora cicadina]|nr:hypothetical protein L0F63_005998 [Massospora cicadina]
MFTEFLDSTMTYSCPIWEECESFSSGPTPATRQLSEEFKDLERAQLRKIHTIIEKAKLMASDHLLEIGSGWGTLAIEAVRLTSCRVTTLTLSSEQKAFAEARISEAGYSHRISVVLMDYRDVHQLGMKFDKIISVEMLEAVGKGYLNTYFEICSQVLKAKGGIMVFQCITIHEPIYYNYCRQVEFIQKAPPHLLSSLVNAIFRGSYGNLIVNEVTNVGAHYTRALRLWRMKFNFNFPTLQKRDPKRYTPKFKRAWDYYFSYSEVGFATHCLGDVIVVLVRPNSPSIFKDIPT